MDESQRGAGDGTGWIPPLTPRCRCVSYFASWEGKRRRNGKGSPSNSEQPKERHNDKHLSRRGPRDTLPVSVLTQHEWSLG